jgi:hypothetical protein
MELQLELEQRYNEIYDVDAKNIQDEKSSVRTNNPKKTDKNDLMSQLYQVARNLDYRFDSSLITTHKSLINFITLMNEVKRHRISEYDMVRFISQQSDYYTPVTFYFHCLKKYNAAKEKLPFTAHELDNELCLDNDLAQLFRIQYKYYSIEDIQKKLTSCPAYINLIDTLRVAANSDSYSGNHYVLYTCLWYSGTKNLFNGYPEYYNIITNFDDFYSEAYKNLCADYDSIYNFINLIACIKNIEIGHIKKIKNKNETEKHYFFSVYFFSKILNHNPIQEIIGIKYNPLNEDSISMSTKHRMALIYKCIELYQYHQKNLYNKKTPTGKQLKAFLSFQRLDISLPDGFDKRVFNENEYAFKQFHELSENIATINNANDAAREQTVKKILNEI